MGQVSLRIVLEPLPLAGRCDMNLNRLFSCNRMITISNQVSIQIGASVRRNYWLGPLRLGLNKNVAAITVAESPIGETLEHIALRRGYNF